MDNINRHNSIKNQLIRKKNKKQQMRRLRLRIILTLFCIIFLSIFSMSKITSFIAIKNEENLKLEAKESEEKRLKAEAEREKAEEEERKKYSVGVNNNAKEYTMDAKIVSEKLRNNDYSNNGEKVVFLTFDDGVSTTTTPEILKILHEHDVKATFFLLGKNIKNGGTAAREIIKSQFEEGHALANHSYSHDYKYLYPNGSLNIKNFVSDFAKTNALLKDILGNYFSTRVLRCPGGYNSWNNMNQLDSYLYEENAVSIDWNALNGDAEGKKKNAQELVDYAIQTSQGKEMVVLLMHDTYGKDATVQALPQIINYYKNNGYTFKTLS